jgi:hypothetical protein
MTTTTTTGLTWGGHVLERQEFYNALWSTTKNCAVFALGDRRSGMRLVQVGKKWPGDGTRWKWTYAHYFVPIEWLPESAPDLGPIDLDEITDIRDAWEASEQ